jgi:hypothetical protein
MRITFSRQAVAAIDNLPNLVIRAPISSGLAITCMAGASSRLPIDMFSAPAMNSP